MNLQKLRALRRTSHVTLVNKRLAASPLQLACFVSTVGATAQTGPAGGLYTHIEQGLKHENQALYQNTCTLSPPLATRFEFVRIVQRFYRLF